MIRIFGITALLCSILLLAGCPKAEQDARDAAAALNGSIIATQQKYQSVCAATPGQPACQMIDRAIESQNALVTATEAYCGWSTLAPPPDPTAVCVPVQSAKAGLTAAILNANLFTVELKGAIQ